VRSCYDAVVVVASMAAVGVVFGFLAGIVADTGALAIPVSAIAFLLTGAVFLFGPVASAMAHRSTSHTRIMKGCR
jgi:hypothetical protein